MDVSSSPDVPGLAACLPGPLPVVLAGEPIVADQFTLADLADLDRWLSALGGPVDLSARAVDPEGESADAFKRRRLAAWRALEERPGLSSPDAGAILDTVPGRAVQLRLSTGRAGDVVSIDDAERLAASCSADEWASFYRIAWGLAEWEPIARDLDPDWWVGKVPKYPTAPQPWSKRLVTLVKVYPQYTLESARRLYLAEWRLLCTSGEAEGYTGPPRKVGEPLKDWLARSAAVFASPAPEVEPAEADNAPSAP